MHKLHLALVAGSLVVAVVAACGSSNDANGGNTGDDGGTSSGVAPFAPDDGGLDPNGQVVPIEIVPADQTVTYSGATAPTVQYTARIISSGTQVPALFAIDRGEIGTIGANTGLFTASGAVGGKA